MSDSSSAGSGDTEAVACDAFDVVAFFAPKPGVVGLALGTAQREEDKLCALGAGAEVESLSDSDVNASCRFGEFCVQNCMYRAVILW